MVIVIKLSYWWIIHQIVLNRLTFQKKVLHEGNEGNVMIISDYHEEGEDTCEGKGHDWKGEEEGDEAYSFDNLYQVISFSFHNFSYQEFLQNLSCGEDDGRERSEDGGNEENKDGEGGGGDEDDEDGDGGDDDGYGDGDDVYAFLTLI